MDTGVKVFYDDTSIISKPTQNQAFYEQDSQYNITHPSYTDNKDGTITDNVTGLVW